MDFNFDKLMAAEGKRMDEVLSQLERLLRPRRRSDANIELPAVTEPRQQEE
jgi:hypothetical protein